MTYRLHVTARAVADADEAYAWIAEHLSPESDKFSEELRELLYGKWNSKYRIVFAIRNEDVVVLYVNYAACKELEP